MMSKQQKRSSSTRCAILDAAVRLITGGGPSGLTIEGVAREAGMSKGGVLYHYHSKDDLVRGLIKSYHQAFWKDLRRHWKADTRTEGRWHRAWIRAQFDSYRLPQDVENATMFASIVSDPGLMLSLRHQITRLQKCLSWDGLDPVWSHLLANAVIGLKFDRMFQFCTFDMTLLDDMEQKCLALLERVLAGELLTTKTIGNSETLTPGKVS